jgi:hypothetical protein
MRDTRIRSMGLVRGKVGLASAGILVLVVSALAAFGAVQMVGTGGAAVGAASPSAGSSATAFASAPSAARASIVEPSPSPSCSLLSGPLPTVAMPTTASSGALTGTQHGVFVSTGSMSVPRVRHTATLLADGRVLIAGGYPRSAGYPVSQSAELFDPSTGRFEKTGDMGRPRGEHLAQLLADGRVLIVGGDGAALQAGTAATAEIYDPATGRFSATASLCASPWQFGLTSLLLADGRVLVAYPGAPGGFEVFDPVNGTWSPLGLRLPGGMTNVVRLLAAADGGILALFSGNDSVLHAVRLVSMSESTALADSGITSVSHATALGDGSVVTVSTLWQGRVGWLVVSRYAPDSGQLESFGAPAGWVCGGASAILLTDGRVLYGNQCLGNGIQSLPMLFDPASGHWTFTGRMEDDRNSHTATLLADGRVLLCGGFQGESGEAVTATAELYLP